MHALLTFLPILAWTFFQANLDNVFNQIRTNDWNRAASTLDQAASDSPDLFALNNLSYLRGRIAENQQDWGRAREEFAKIAAENPLRPLAQWHIARVAARLGDQQGAMDSFDALPFDFPVDLKMQFAAEASPELALRIYATLTTREARLQRALAVNDSRALWALLRERNSDDAGLQAARTLETRVSSPQEAFDLAETYLAHRQFGNAIRLYETAGADARLREQSRFQIARSHFLAEDYRTALIGFIDVAKEYAGTSREKDAEYQAASCYWRLGEYKSAEKAYLDYIAQYGSAEEEGAVRNLVDVYRILGDNTRALTWIDRGLASRLTAATRQGFLFTKAKVLYIQKRYAAALELFGQLGRTRIRSTPSGTTKDEARYYEALTLSRLGRTTAANAIFRELAAEPFTYYGQKAGQQLGRPVVTRDSASLCEVQLDPVRTQAEDSINVLRRPMRTEPQTISDALTELMFLELWDEAFVWIDRQSRPDPRTAAELAYLAGRYNRSIAYATRLPQADPYTQALLHPSGFRPLICKAASTYGVDPLWLHAIIWQESRYNPLARSPASARGLMQFVPDTASTVAADLAALTGGAGGTSREFSLDLLYDPAFNIQLGAHYWASLMNEFKQPELALAAYNGGPANVRRWKAKWPEGSAEFFVADIGFIETKNYVMAVFAARAAYESR